MIFQVTMKTPDALENAIYEAAEGEVMGPSDSPEHDEKYQEVVKQATEAASKWFQYGELVKLEIDTTAGTCKVIPASS